MNCPYCDHHITYTLKTAQKKCAKCLKKFSEKKILFEKKVINLFTEDYTINRCVKEHNLNYTTIKNKYENYRKSIASFLEDEYKNQEVKEYDEYIYLAQSKQKIKENYFKEFSKFMMLNKISKIQKKENIIASFWIFFEESILKYKGINKDNFFYYLKEIELKFNYSIKEQRNILYKLVK